MRVFKIGDLVEFKSKHLELDYGELVGTYGVLLNPVADLPIWQIMWQGHILAISEFDLRRVGSV